MNLTLPRPNFQNKKQIISLGLGVFVLIAIPLTVYLSMKSEDSQNLGTKAAAIYTVDSLIADMNGTTEGTLCAPVNSYDFGQRGDGLPASFETINGTQVTGWGTAQWASCGGDVSGVRLQIQNYKLYGWTGSNWVTYGGQPGDWCVSSNVDTGTGFSSDCANTGSISSPNFSMPTGQRAIHWANSRLSVISGSRCFVNYYESKSSGAAPILVNAGADDIDPNVSIQPRHYVSRYKLINSIDWTSIGGSNCPETVLRSNPPPGFGGNTPVDTTPPTVIFDQPFVNNIVAGNAVKVWTSASDDSGTVSRVEFFLDNSVTPFATDTISPFRVTWNSTTVLDGAHALKAVAYDPSGNLASQQVSITVNNINPSLDSDGDGFSDLIEQFMGTRKDQTCGQKAWPPDFNGDNAVTVGDQAELSSKVTSVIGDVKYNRLYDLNADGGVNVGDQAIIVSQLSKKCVGYIPSWNITDIGNTGLSGKTTQTGSSFTLLGSGSDIWGTTDNFHYFSRIGVSNFSLVARVNSQTNTQEWAKAGIMVRDKTEAGSKHVNLFVSPTHGIAFQYRTSTNGGSAESTREVPYTFPIWLKLSRVGNIFTAYKSTDGVTWLQVGAPVTVQMIINPRAGLAVTSHNNTVTSTAVFDNVVFTTP